MERTHAVIVTVLCDSANGSGGIDCFYGPGICRHWLNYFSTGARGLASIFDQVIEDFGQSKLNRNILPAKDKPSDLGGEHQFFRGSPYWGHIKVLIHTYRSSRVQPDSVVARMVIFDRRGFVLIENASGSSSWWR
jgi:hypothetical protein